jgi:hypothetical protein
VQLWMDGDKVASTRIGALLLEHASRLTRHGAFCSILTREELWLEQKAVGVLQWLSKLAESCHPFCNTVAACILPNRHLVPLLEADFKMSARVMKAWYSLLLTLLAVPTFKSHLAAAYCDTYRSVTAKYARGMGVLERSGYQLSVQFLNRVQYVVDLVQGRDLLGKLGKTLLDTLLVARRPRNLNGRLNPNHHVLAHRRYSPCISDLKCVLNVKGMPRLFAAKGGTFLGDWIEVLSIAQFMDPQSWRHWTFGHVEDESRGWVGAFNASISLGSIFERLLSWEDEEPSPITDSTSPLSRNLMPCLELTFHILVEGVSRWQKSEVLFYDSTPNSSVIEFHKRCPASLPFSTIAAQRGTALAMRQLPISQVTPFSFHLPLHRFVAGCIRELCLRKHDLTGGMAGLMELLRSELSPRDQDELFRGLMEFPVLVLSRASQIRASLWRRNGPALGDQVLNYAEPPFCRSMRDADLLLAQFAVLGRTQHQSSGSRPNSDVGMAFFVNLLLHRLGIFEFCGLSKAPNWNINKYLEEVEQGLYSAERLPQDAMPTDLALPWSFSIARDVASSLVLLEEFLHTMIVFAGELPHVVPQDTEHMTRQARWRLYREVVHRLASGPKAHSELQDGHHVLSHRDNVLLNEEGKTINPDDASGAVLSTVVSEVADIIRGQKTGPIRWGLHKTAWESYDPSFYHINLRNHQTAAEGRPRPNADSSLPFGWEPKVYAPTPPEPHPFFARLRRDTTADATVLGLVYRVLHLHCREKTSRDINDLPGKTAYDSSEKSETAVVRAVHLLTLGVYAWRDAAESDTEWREHGGGSVGSVFYNRDDMSPPLVSDWIASAMLSQPQNLLECDWFLEEESMLLLLRRLAVNGGTVGGFVAQDRCVRAGAAWLCDFSAKHNSEAARILRPAETDSADTNEDERNQSEIAQRKLRAKNAALAKMKAQAAKFATMMELDVGDSDEDTSQKGPSVDAELVATTPNRPIRATSFGSAFSGASSITTPGGTEDEVSTPQIPFPSDTFGLEQDGIPNRLLKGRPRCIICNDEESTGNRMFDRAGGNEGESQRKRSRRKTENALGFVGYAQASTVLKGGGPPPDLDSSASPVREFVGIHTALCGHAVHSECCESYLATVSHREDRAIGKRDEFRCPLCQRLSNCLVPFIDVGIDWIESPTCLPVQGGEPADDIVKINESLGELRSEYSQPDEPLSLHDFLSTTPWWVTRLGSGIEWDGQSAFVDGQRYTGRMMDGIAAKKTDRRRAVRSLRKKDLYAAWNAMMRTPRFVRRKLRPRAFQAEDSSHSQLENSSVQVSDPEESTGETIVWRRFMDQISDLSYRADSKRLGDEHLHDLFGEFRHYIVEKYAYNMLNRFSGSDQVDWPSCLFIQTLPDQLKQEMSREKLLSKLLLSIQSFAYSCSCEAFEARRAFRKVRNSAQAAASRQDTGHDAVFSRFGIKDVVCDGRLVIMSQPSLEDDGFQPFNGRLGKLRYLGLAVMAAAGAVAGDLVQLVLAFPVQAKEMNSVTADLTMPERAPVVYPVLFGNVLTHVVAAMCATCGRGRARSDSLDMIWPLPFSRQGSFIFPDDFASRKRVDSVVEDCEGFLRLGLLARVLQVLLGAMHLPISGLRHPDLYAADLKKTLESWEESPSSTNSWMRGCGKLLHLALSSTESCVLSSDVPFSLELFQSATSLACSAACSYLEDAGLILQVLVPGAIGRYIPNDSILLRDVHDSPSNFHIFEELSSFFKLEDIEVIMDSNLVKTVVSEWYRKACFHAQKAIPEGMKDFIPSDPKSMLQSRLHRTQGYRVQDWPSTGSTSSFSKASCSGERDDPNFQMQYSVAHVAASVERTSLLSRQSSVMIRQIPSPTLLSFTSKKTVPLLGGFSQELSQLSVKKFLTHPHIKVIPTSYTDLYAELGTLLPDCEQTAVCLICGQVLNAGGKGECTRHANKCGAGAGIFFLLQECSGLLLHKSKACYIHSPYVDSHGETPQYRGRPLNLDASRYEHLQEIWYGHGVRQQVVAERGSSRQVILPEFY